MTRKDRAILARAVSNALDIATPEQSEGVYVLIHEIAQAVLMDDPTVDVVDFLHDCGVPT